MLRANSTKTPLPGSLSWSYEIVKVLLVDVGPIAGCNAMLRTRGETLRVQGLVDTGGCVGVCVWCVCVCVN